jgi:hypothetical protein
MVPHFNVETQEERSQWALPTIARSDEVKGDSG